MAGSDAGEYLLDRPEALPSPIHAGCLAEEEFAKRLGLGNSSEHLAHLSR